MGNTPVNRTMKSIRQNAEVVWILLTDEQTADLYNAAMKAGIHAETQIYDGHWKTSGMLKEMAEKSTRGKRISMKQLLVIQQYYATQMNDFLYIEGLEYYLMKNEVLVDKYRDRLKRIKARKAKDIERGDFRQ